MSPAHRAAGFFIVTLFLVVTYRMEFAPIGPGGMDSGWRWAINHAWHADMVFGRDLVFTYGPLGHLVAPLDIGSNLSNALLFAVGLHLLMGLSVTLAWLRNRRLAPLALFTLMYAVAATNLLGGEIRWMLDVAIVAWAAVSIGSWFLWGLAAAVAGVFLLVKLSLGVAATASVGLAFVALLMTDAGAGRRAAVTVTTVTAATGALALWCFGSPAAMLRWFTLAREMVSGYPEALSLVGSTATLVVGLVILVSLITMAIIERREHHQTAMYMVLAPTLLIAFRLGFVRQDAHEVQFFGYVLGVVAAAALASTVRCRQVILTALFVAVFATGSVVASRHGSASGAVAMSHLSYRQGVNSLIRSLRLQATREDLARRSEENLGRLRLPPSVVRDLESAAGGVGVIPWEVLLCPANGLEWNPAPTIQLYATYTQRLDAFSAAHYASDRAPGIILDQMVPDGILRHRMIDAPATWRAIYLRYQPRLVLPDWRLVALEKRPDAIPERWRTLAAVDASIDTHLPVPRSGGLLFAEIELRPTIWGRLQRGLFRIPPVYLMVHHRSGADTAYRLIPATASAGVLVNRLPSDLDGYLALWSGAEVDDVVEISITGPGAFLYSSPFRITWRELG